MAYLLTFLLKKMWVAFAFQKLLAFFQQNTYIIGKNIGQVV